jgi:BirA family biotin operon repressor/biotin-[acetyl-CoA-carboxylase] ligase
MNCEISYNGRMTETLNTEKLENALQGLPLGRICFFEETDSTNEQGLKMAAQGADELTLLVAERQTAGRGRLGRKWVTAPGASLAFSLILKPSQAEISHLSLFSLLGGLAVCLAIEDYAQITAQVKWPNDVLLNGMKTAGILAESCWQGEQLAGVVLGIGINLQPGSAPPAGEVLYPATCLQDHTPVTVERLPFLRAVLAQLIALRQQIMGENFIQEYTRRLAFVNQPVMLSSGQGDSCSGVVLGVQADGQLRLRLAGGTEASFPIGELRLRPEG